MSYSDFSVIIPVYNEMENIPILIEEINTTLQNKYNYEIIFIDDCSKDNSYQILNQYKNKNQIRIFKNKKNLGQSYSINKGVNNAANNIIVTLDADGQNDPKDIPKLIEAYKKQNVKLLGGIREKRRDNLVKIFSSKIANNIRQAILDDNCKDTGCGLKIFDKNIFLSFPYFNGIHRFLPALFKGYGYKTNFINVNHRERKYGKSKYGTIDRLFRGIRDIIKVKKIINQQTK